MNCCTRTLARIVDVFSSSRNQRARVPDPSHAFYSIWCYQAMFMRTLTGQPITASSNPLSSKTPLGNFSSSQLRHAARKRILHHSTNDLGYELSM